MTQSRMLPSIPKGAEELIIHAITDMNERFDTIKASSHYQQYTGDGDVIVEILFNITVGFLIGQILEVSKKSAMINNKTKKPLSPSKRFIVMMNRVMHHMHQVGNKAAKGLMP